MFQYTKLSIIILITIVLTGCTTPKTMLKHPKTGQVVSCGGNTTSSITGGAFGYYVQKSDDTECKGDYLEEGFKVINKTPDSQNKT